MEELVTRSLNVIEKFIAKKVRQWNARVSGINENDFMNVALAYCAFAVLYYPSTLWRRS